MEATFSPDEEVESPVENNLKFFKIINVFFNLYFVCMFKCYEKTTSFIYYKIKFLFSFFFFRKISRVGTLALFRTYIKTNETERIFK